MTVRGVWGLGVVLATALVSAPGRAEEVTPPEAPAAQAVPVKAVEPADDPPYDATGRRDPFRAPRTGATGGEARTPLQMYDVGQLRLVAVIYDTHEPRAVVEDDQGLGYIVRIGTPVGSNGGQVSAIERGRVMIREDAVDYYGEHRPNEVTMELRTAERTAERADRAERAERGKQ